MATEVIMPKAGVDMTEGEIVKWNKKVGDEVKEGEILLEILTDKVSMELEAETDGYLIAILKNDGEKVPVTEVIGYIGAQGEEVPTASASAQPAPAADTAQSAEPQSAPVHTAASGKKDYDIIVIGGGPAGYVAAIRASQLGAKVALVEKKALGGTCLNRGCIPTKAFLHNVEIIEAVQHAQKHGIKIQDPSISIDMPQVLKTKNQVVSVLVGGVSALLKSNNVTVFKATGKITKDKKVALDDGSIIEADKIILAGGSKASKIPIPGIESELVMTSDEILDLDTVPESLAIIGGGVIGVELGEVFAAFGTKVTIIEMMDRIVPAMDKEVSAALKTALGKHNLTILTSTKLQEIVEENGKLTIKIEGKDDLVVEKALLSIGRVPDLEAIGELEFDLEKGRIKVDKYMETSVEGIYAPGDINGTKMLAHAAFRMGEVAAENAVNGNHLVAKLAMTPAAIYTIPEAAMVGLTEEQARAQYGDIRIGRFNFSANGRSIATDATEGFIKVIADNKYGEVLGIHIIGPCAAELINEAATIMEMELTVEELLTTIHGHPTYSEALYEAFADVLGLAIHAMRKNK